MVNPVLNRITLKDRIEVTLAVVERCMATQTGTNADGTPIYAVAPPVEVRTWYDSNGAPAIVTNSIEWRDDLSIKVDLDAKIMALIPCYVDTNTIYDDTTNISMLTVTGLFASLQIGDHTNQFTSIPAIGTNAASYGPWAWRNYVMAWQERYKVLNALEYSLVGQPTTLNGSKGHDERSTGLGYPVDWVAYYYSNIITGEIKIGYEPSWNAAAVGKTVRSELSTNSNYVYLDILDKEDLLWDEAKQINSKAWYYGLTNTTPYYGSNYIIVTTNDGDAYGFGVEVGGGTFAYRYPNVTIGTNTWFYIGSGGNKQYATWRWDNYQIDGLTNILAVFVKPRANYYSIETEIVTDAHWSWPRSWVSNIVSDFAEMQGMTESKYYQIASEHVHKNAGYWEIDFGHDEFNVLKSGGTYPTWCEEPASIENPTNNYGSIGQLYGCWLNPQITYGFKKWQFSYCTNKYW
jgi:hypothetical protein